MHEFYVYFTVIYYILFIIAYAPNVWCSLVEYVPKHKEICREIVNYFFPIFPVCVIMLLVGG